MKQMSRRIALILVAILLFSLTAADFLAAKKQLPVSISRNEKSGYDVYWPITAKEFVEAFNATAADRGEKDQRIESYKKKERFSASWAEGKVYMFVNMFRNGYISGFDFNYRMEDEAYQKTGRSVLKTLTATLCRNDKKGDALFKKLIAQIEEEMRVYSEAGYRLENHEIIEESCRFYFDVSPVEVSISITPRENKSTKEGAPMPTAPPTAETPKPTQAPFVYLKLNTVLYHRRMNCPKFDVEDGELINKAYLHQIKKNKIYVPCSVCVEEED